MYSKRVKKLLNKLKIDERKKNKKLKKMKILEKIFSKNMKAITENKGKKEKLRVEEKEQLCIVYYTAMCSTKT